MSTSSFPGSTLFSSSELADVAAPSGITHFKALFTVPVPPIGTCRRRGLTGDPEARQNAPIAAANPRRRSCSRSPRSTFTVARRHVGQDRDEPGVRRTRSRSASTTSSSRSPAVPAAGRARRRPATRATPVQDAPSTCCPNTDGSMCPATLGSMCRFSGGARPSLHARACSNVDIKVALVRRNAQEGRR